MLSTAGLIMLGGSGGSNGLNLETVNITDNVTTTTSDGYDGIGKAIVNVAVDNPKCDGFLSHIAEQVESNGVGPYSIGSSNWSYMIGVASNYLGVDVYCTSTSSIVRYPYWQLGYYSYIVFYDGSTPIFAYRISTSGFYDATTSTSGTSSVDYYSNMTYYRWSELTEVTFTPSDESLGFTYSYSNSKGTYTFGTFKFSYTTYRYTYSSNTSAVYTTSSSSATFTFVVSEGLTSAIIGPYANSSFNYAFITDLDRATFTEKLISFMLALLNARG